VEEPSCPLPQTESISRNVQADIPEECRCAAAFPRGGKILPRIRDGSKSSNTGWAHIEAKHITGEDPGGDLFAPGTTRAELEQAAISLLQGTRISAPEQDPQIFEDRMVINGKRDRIRVVFLVNTCEVQTIFPVRQE
jgi:hypothetical protein